MRAAIQAADQTLAGVDRRLAPLAQYVARHKPRHTGAVATLILVGGAVLFGTVRGQHVDAAFEWLRDTRDAAANAAGFGVTRLSISGRKQLSEQEVLGAAGITERSSLLFLDVEATRRRLEASPWITTAAVRKLYPGQLEIEIQERQAFAYWQSGGKLSIIADDGTVLGPLTDRQGPILPLVVGPGANLRARAMLTLLERAPELRSEMRALVLVAERRWTLKLKSGLDIRLPELGVAEAIELLVSLDRDRKILTRDLTAVDLRLAGRVIVRLSDEAAQARENAAKEKAKRRKGGDA